MINLSAYSHALYVALFIVDPARAARIRIFLRRIKALHFSRGNRKCVEKRGRSSITHAT
jgi:hypothetical protein